MRITQHPIAGGQWAKAASAPMTGSQCSGQTIGLFPSYIKSIVCFASSCSRVGLPPRDAAALHGLPWILPSSGVVNRITSAVVGDDGVIARGGATSPDRNCTESAELALERRITNTIQILLRTHPHLAAALINVASVLGLSYLILQQTCPPHSFPIARSSAPSARIDMHLVQDEERYPGAAPSRGRATTADQTTLRWHPLQCNLVPSRGLDERRRLVTTGPGIQGRP